MLIKEARHKEYSLHSSIWEVQEKERQIHFKKQLSLGIGELSGKWHKGNFGHEENISLFECTWEYTFFKSKRILHSKAVSMNTKYA